MHNLQWSKTEKQIARAAFEQALARECAQIIAGVREEAGALQTMEDVWKLSDHLNELARELPGKYDYRYSQLLYVFGRLISEGWLTLDELAGLDEDKLERLRWMTR
jgi:hypothetical protein